MSDVQHYPETLWDMPAHAFIRGCYACLVPSDTLLSDVRYIRITAAQQRRMELAMSKGYLIYSDGSDTLVWTDDRFLPLFLVLTDDEWEGSQL